MPRNTMTDLSGHEKLNGAVKWFNSEKGYGFIQPDSTDGYGREKDVFVHATDLQKSGIQAGEMYEGRRVRFAARPGRSGKLQAEDISFID